MANQILEGRVGQTTFYARKGVQVARQSKNNSNYGAGASRTTAQMLRRIKWANLVNFYKVCKFWMPKAFEGAVGGVTVYNRFMALNIQEALVMLTKQEALAGASVVDSQWISRGSLPTISWDTEQSAPTSSIVASAGIIGEGKTLGEFSTDIIEKNQDWVDGDNLALVAFMNNTDSLGINRVSCRYYEVTLDTTSTVLMTSLAIVSEAALAVNNGHIGVTRGGAYFNSGGLALVHTRKVGGKLYVSSQRVAFTEFNVLEKYISDEQQSKAIDSYGVDAAVPLDPGF